MDQKTTKYFDLIIHLARSSFEQVDYEVNMTPDRSILNIQAKHGKYNIFVTELFSDQKRKYRYYVLQADYVEAGFDNSPDPRAIRLKYGKIGKERAGKLVPHMHLNDKNHLILTEEMTFQKFIEWFRINIE